MTALATLANLRRFRPFSLEELLTAPDLLGLTDATPLQRAICRIVDGRNLGELLDHPDILEAIGDCRAIDGKRIAELIHISAIRGAKSLFCVACGFYSAVTTDLSFLRQGGEHGTVSIVSVSMRTARPTLLHLRSIEQKPELARYLLEEPKTDAIVVRNAYGIPVDIHVVPGSRDGNNMVGRWQVTVIFDEAPRMNGVEDGVVNWDEQREAVYGRIVPGGQILSAGSPKGPIGPIHEMVQKHWRRPTPEMVVVRARGELVNPSWWTPERIAFVKANQPDAYVTDYLAEFASGEDDLFSAQALMAAERKPIDHPPLPDGRPSPYRPQDLPYDPSLHYRAAIDPATSANAWTFGIGTRQGRVRKVAYAKQWRGTKAEPLKLRATIADIAAACALYDITQVETDRHLAPAIVELGREAGLTFYPSMGTDAESTEGFLSLAARVLANEVELPPEPMVRMDLQRLRKVPKPGGGVSIKFVTTSDGRHCDYAPCLNRVFSAWIKDEDAVPLDPASPEATRLHGEKIKAARFREVAQRNAKIDKTRRFTTGR